MPLALLLSPDDQAVSAITAVLEEMSVTCERPLDGASAARQLSSHDFDLVLVDCENLPAAKLIFDVCRRGRNGNNPVPIAIVDGRAGLPTAFRLGAELILTKPVAKDQARTTVRTAVGRIKKEDSSPVSQPTAQESPGTADISSVTEPASAKDASHAEGLLTNYETETAVASSLPEPRAMAASAAATPAPEKSFTQASSEVAAPTFKTSEPVASISQSLAEPKPGLKAPEFKPSDDPVLAELEQTERKKPEPSAIPESPAPIFSSYPQKQSKSHGPFVAVLLLVIAAGGFYAAWMYQPGFRTLVQPQVDRILALAGLSQPAQTPAVATAKVSTPVAPAPAPVQTAAQPTDGASAGNAAPAAPDTADQTTSAPAVSPTAQPAISQPAASNPTPAATTASDSRLKTPGAAETTKTVAGSGAVKNPGAAASDSELPGEKTALILSSKGAEKRLIHSVRAAYPADARPAGAEGTVVLKAVINESGRVEGARVVEGSPVLAPAAIGAVKQYRYRPYVRDGKTLPFQTIVLVDFQRP